MRSVIPKRYLFLDIDGVIVTHRSLSASKEMDNFIPDMTGVNFLRKFCTKFGVDIIISSSWRRHHKMLYQLLHETKLIHNLLTPWDMFKSLTPIGLVMPSRPADNEYKSVCWGRAFEIKSFLDSNGFDYENDMAIIVDDDFVDVCYYDDKPNFLVVTTHWSNGISFKNMEDMNNFMVVDNEKSS